MYIYYMYYCYRGDHTEVVDIEYDPELVSYTHLLSLFWNNHEYGLTTKIKRQVSYQFSFYILGTFQLITQGNTSIILSLCLLSNKQLRE